MVQLKQFSGTVWNNTEACDIELDLNCDDVEVTVDMDEEQVHEMIKMLQSMKNQIN